MKIPLNQIHPNPQQPRKVFAQEELQNLATSIIEVGLIQPVVVEEYQVGNYWLIDGERRWQAHKLAGLTEIEAVVRNRLNGDGERLKQSLVANLQRADLNVIEEAQAYRNLKEIFKLSDNKIALMVGRSGATIKSRMDLLELEEEIQAEIAAGNFSHDTRIRIKLMEIKDPVARVKLVQRLAGRGLMVTAVVAAINFYLKSVERSFAENSMDSDVGNSSKAPAIFIPEKRYKRSDRKWGLLQQAGKLPAWELVRKSAESVCDACSLRDLASKETCKDCPAVALVEQLMKRSENSDES